MNKQTKYNQNILKKNFNLLQEFKKVSIYKHSSKDIILTLFKEDQEVGLEDTLETINFLKENYIASKKYFGITYTSKGASISEKAREYWSKSEFIQSKTCSLAIIYSQLSQRFLVSMYLKFNKPKTPIKSFKKISDAIDWLISEGA